MFNEAVIVGRLTKTPELKRLSSGKAVTTVCVAVNRGYDSADGQNADYPPVVCWDKTAENLCEFCEKGSLVLVKGSLRTRKIEKENQPNIYVMEVVANKVVYLDHRKNIQKQELDEQNIDDVDIDELMNQLASQIPE